MSKLYYNWSELESDLADIIQQMVVDSYKPDVIIAPGRGGYIPGVMLSHYFDVPFEGFKWQFRDDKIQDDKTLKHILEHHVSDNILIVDDINDSGKTLKTIDDVVHSIPLYGDIRIATLFSKAHSNFNEVDFYARELTIDDGDPWIVFPFEEWWK
jgi:hypoxanthine phosphoribosyltransferase